MTEATDIELIDSILKEMSRIWGDDEGFGGTYQEYRWLAKNYEITEEEDVKWQFLLQESTGDLPEEDAEDPEVKEFLEDNEAVYSFLESLLSKYKGSTAVYPR